jgi:hypothetical protein
MKVKITKDWAGYSKGDTVEIKDKDVLKKGFEIKLFEGKMPKEEDDETPES